MRAIPKKLPHPHTGIRFPVFPERFPYPHGREYSAGNLAYASNHCYHDPCYYHWLASMEAYARHGKMVRKGRSGQ